MAFSLDNLIKNVWSDFQNVKVDPCIVKNSIPIIWFGDMNAYLGNGNRRIVTIGLNPSKREFQDSNLSLSKCVRFPNASYLVNNISLNSLEIPDYIAAMNEYFVLKPYTTWFNHYERILNQLDSSYFNKIGYHHAIHIDACSPVATDPAWGGLCSSQKNRLMSDWDKFFSDFFNFLKPQIILISANQDIVNKIFTSVSWINHTNSTTYLKSSKKGNQIIIWGYNNRGIPFGMKKGISINYEITKLKQKYKL